jgi:hypothetical protein
VSRNASARGHGRTAAAAPASGLTEPVLIIWGVAGTGKSTFARWLRDRRGFHYIDTDTVGSSSAGPLEAAWVATFNRLTPPDSFLAKAARYGRPLVAEYGLWANSENIALLSQLRDGGAVTWWFDGDRDAAFDAWRAENKRSSRAFPDQLWRDVVGMINANWQLLASFYDLRMVQTVRPGPAHLLPEDIYEVLAADLAG